jgi:hypothetical protein
MRIASIGIDLGKTTFSPGCIADPVSAGTRIRAHDRAVSRLQAESRGARE